MNIEEPDFQKLQLELSDPPATPSETFVQQKIEEQEKSRNDDELRLEQFEKRLQERIDLQDAKYEVVPSADQIEREILEEEAILAEQRRLNEQRLAQQKLLEEQQQQLLEERRKEQLEKLNNQIQQRIENTLKRDLAEKLEKETTESENEKDEDGKRRRSKDSSPLERVATLVKRRKVRRRRPKPSESVEPLEESSSGNPFTKFGNGQSRFGFGG